MEPRLEIKIQGLPDVEKKVTKLIGVLDTRSILDESGAILFNRIRTRFLQERAADGSQWVKSKAALERATSGRGGGTLYDTGKLFHSLQLSAVNATESAISTNVPYALYVNENPNWEFLAFGDEDVSVSTRNVIRRIEQVINS